jgi:hypothetical protein
MPNKTNKQKITKRESNAVKTAKNGLASLEKFIKAHPNLASDMDLQKVSKDLNKIVGQCGHSAFGGLTGPDGGT